MERVREFGTTLPEGFDPSQQDIVRGIGGHQPEWSKRTVRWKILSRAQEFAQVRSADAQDHGCELLGPPLCYQLDTFCPKSKLRNATGRPLESMSRSLERRLSSLKLTRARVEMCNFTVFSQGLSARFSQATAWRSCHLGGVWILLFALQARPSRCLAQGTVVFSAWSALIK